MRLPIHAWVVAVLFLPACAWSQNARQDSRVEDIYGWVERVAIGDNGLVLKAKLDTGATTSSISAKDISYFERDGDKWVRFSVYSKVQDRDEEFEAKLVRHVKIRRHGGKVQRRPVVRLDMCIGDIHRGRQFTLIDRSGFLYPVLVGRNYLGGYIVVDADATFTREPGCDEPSPPASAADKETTIDDLEEE